MSSQTPWVIRPQVRDEIYTDRQEFIDYFYESALNAASRRSISTVLLGQRRMGKTEIFIRTVNRLFFEQDHRDPQAVVPIFYTFPEEAVDRWEFSTRYVENFLRWYTAFRLHKPELVNSRFIRREQLSSFIRENLKVPQGLQGALNLFDWVQEKDVTIPELDVLELPRSVSDRDDTTIAIFDSFCFQK